MYPVKYNYSHCLSLAVPGSGLSPGAVAGIVAVVLLAAAVAVVAGFVMYYRCKISELERQRGKYHTQFM